MGAAFFHLAKFVDEKSRVTSSMYGVDLTKEYSQTNMGGLLLVKLRIIGPMSQL